MIDDSHLPYFITETLYVLSEPAKTENEQEDSEKIEVQDPETQAQEAPETAQLEATAPSPPQSVVHEPTPTIPKQIKEEVKNVALAIWAPPLMPEDKTLIQNILKAINQDFDKAKMMSGISSYESNYERLLCFGYEKELELKIGKAIPLYEPTEVSGKKIITSGTPELLHQNTEQKKQLWGALQKMFPKT